MKSKKIRVANPASGHLTFISEQAAERYVARGRARWQSPRVIFFIEDTHDRRAAERSAQLDRQLGYDRVGAMTMDQMAGIPIVGDLMRLFTLR